MSAVPVMLSPKQITTAMLLVSAAQRKAERQLAKSDYVPEPGKRHGDQNRIDALQEIVEAFATALEEAGAI